MISPYRHKSGIFLLRRDLLSSTICDLFVAVPKLNTGMKCNQRIFVLHFVSVNSTFDAVAAYLIAIIAPLSNLGKEQKKQKKNENNLTPVELAL